MGMKEPVLVKAFSSRQFRGDVGRLVEFPLAQSKSARRVAASPCTHPPFLFRKIKKGKNKETTT
jgi:hypothetical protein